MDIRNNKGITLMAEVMTVLLLLMIISIISYSSMSSLQVRNLNNMYSDVVSIQEKAANYYLKTGKAPVTTEKVSDSVVSKMVGASQKNPNDAYDAANASNTKYYKIDFSVFSNMSLNNKQTSDNFYYMNEKTLTVYYSKGVTIDNLNSGNSTVYYTLPANYTKPTGGTLTAVNSNSYQD